jgi:acyl-CoA thioesterase-1
MMRFILLVGGLLAAMASLAGSPTTILVVGDSLSAAHGMDREDGWVALMEQRLGQRDGHYRVVNASIGGDTTRGGRSRLPAALADHEPDIVIIELGGNDGLRGIPLSETRRNLAAMIEAAHAHDGRVLLLGVRLPTNYGSAFIERFQAVFRDLGNDYDIAVVQKFLAGVGEEPELMQADGIHPTAEAQPRLLANVWPELETLLEKARPSRVTARADEDED